MKKAHSNSEGQNDNEVKLGYVLQDRSSRHLTPGILILEYVRTYNNLIMYRGIVLQ